MHYLYRSNFIQYLAELCFLIRHLVYFFFLRKLLLLEKKKGAQLYVTSSQQNCAFIIQQNDVT